MFENIKLTQLNTHVWMMNEKCSSGQATGYIVVGSEKAAVIDTMFGSEDVNTVVRTVTDLPVMVINTHGHVDHIGGNIFFGDAYMNPADNVLFEELISEPGVQAEIEKNGHTVPRFEPLCDGDVIDLGGLTLEIFDIPGHTRGGILVLLVEDRILFTGDSINRCLWMQLDHSLSIEKMLESCEKLTYLELEADTILHGHADGFEDISLMREMTDGLRSLLAGETENDRPYEWFQGTDMCHPFGETGIICYRKDNITEAKD